MRRRYLVVAIDHEGNVWTNPARTARQAKQGKRDYQAEPLPWRAHIIDLDAIPELNEKVKAKKA